MVISSFNRAHKKIMTRSLKKTRTHEMFLSEKEEILCETPLPPTGSSAWEPLGKRLS